MYWQYAIVSEGGSDEEGRGRLIVGFSVCKCGGGVLEDILRLADTSDTSDTLG